MMSKSFKIYFFCWVIATYYLLQKLTINSLIKKVLGFLLIHNYSFTKAPWNNHLNHSLHLNRVWELFLKCISLNCLLLFFVLVVGFRTQAFHWVTFIYHWGFCTKVNIFFISIHSFIHTGIQLFSRHKFVYKYSWDFQIHIITWFGFS